MLALGFDRTTIFRPGMLLCDRRNRSFGETAVMAIVKPISWVAPRWISAPMDFLAKAMVESLYHPLSAGQTSEVISNAGIHELACAYDRREQGINSGSQ